MTKKQILTAVIAVVLIVAAVIGYLFYLQRAGKEDNAQETVSLVEIGEISLPESEPGSVTDPGTEAADASTEELETLPPQTDPPGFWEDLTLPPQTDPPGFWESLTDSDQTDPPETILPWGTDPEPTLPPQTDPPETDAPVMQAPTQSAGSGIYVTQNGTYTDREGVAQYLHTYGRLPSNFITKKQAQSMGWSSGKSLSTYAPGKSIGGDYFSNYEGVPGRGTFHECDINYKSGKRGAERIVWSGDGRIFYSPDHYKTYYEWKGPNQWVYAYTAP